MNITEGFDDTLTEGAQMGTVHAMSKARHFVTLAIVAIALACTEGGPSPTAPSISPSGLAFTITGTPNKQDWKQCQNAKSPTSACKWVTGNLDQSHNRYFEGDVVPHALRISTITNGDPITVIMTYGFKKANKSTHDFLARWNATQVNANPCTDGSFKGGNTANNPPTTFCSGSTLNPITARSNDMGSLVQVAGALCGGNDAAEQAAAINAFNATFPTNATYPDGQKVIEGVNVSSIVVNSIATACSGNGDAETTLNMTVVPNAAGIASKNLLLLIGSHIANGLYWTTFGGAAGVSGSPYHLGLVTVDGIQAGSMDLQMSAAVVLIPGATLAIQKETIGGTGSFNFVGSGAGVPSAFTRNTGSGGNPTTGPGFNISNLEFGTKYVQETVPAGWDLTDIECTAGGADIVIGRGGSGSFVNGGTNDFDNGDNTVKVIISSGDAPSCTFINTKEPVGSISGKKFHDIAANGTIDSPDDVGLSGWVIRLYQGTTLIATDTTDSQGAYSFIDIPPGTYRVCEVLQSGWIESYPAAGAACTGTGEAAFGHTITLDANENETGQDFANYRNANIQVRKFEDLDANGSKDGSDAFITWAANMHVFDAGSVVHQHAQITNATNGASFSVKPGTYTICESIIATWFQSAPGAGVDCSTHTGAAGNGFSVTVTSNQSVTRDFGNYRNGSITVRKWNDANQSGTKDGESYITWAADMHVFNAGLTVHQHAQITDAANGVSFTVAPGTYTICESQITGWIQTAPGAGVDCSGHTGAAANGFSVTVTSNQAIAREFGNSEPPPPPSALFILIDEDGIDNGDRYWENASPFNSTTIKAFSTSEVNDDVPHLAQRMPLRYFQNNIGKTIWLWTGQVGDEGWFAPRTIPSSWASAGPTADGLRNFLGNPASAFPHDVGPGLGTGGNPESLLDNIPNVIPLRAEGLYQLIGSTVCALVWDSDISINYGPITGSLKGEKLGVAAFQVQDVVYLSGFSSSTLPRVKIQIVDALTACGGTVSLFTTPPVPSSSSVPADIRPNFTGDNGGYQ